MSPQGLDHQSNGVHFFKVILESCVQDGEMKVPRSFVGRHWKGISNPVFLRLPNGTEWKVSWTERDVDVWFCNGWKEFAEYLSLSVSQFVVFQYEENCRFNVLVFGKSGLEIKYPLRETGEEGEEEVDESDRSVKIIEDGSPLRDRKRKSASPSSQTCKKIKTNPTDQKAAGSSNDLKDGIKALLEKVKKDFQPDKEFFTCAIQKTYTERDVLLIPKEFSKPHLHNMEGRSATLFIDQGRTWDVELKPHTGRQIKFTSGWRKFFMDNNLKMGDVCAFVLHKCKGLSFEVTIFPLGKDTSSPLFEDQEGPSHSPSSSSLRTPETPKADIRLMSKSKNDFSLYVKRPFHLANIPINYIRSFVSENGKTVTLRVGQSSWPVKLLFYDYNSSARFSQGWFQFAKDCNLDAGDSCHFKVVDEEKLEIEVTISRHSR